MLTPAQLAAREGKLTASAVACLMTGNEQKIMNLWREMIGDPSYERENLDHIWAVQLGTATEALNLAWYERRTGRKLIRVGEVVVHPVHDWAAATLDGFDAEMNRPVECKHVGGRERREVVQQRYQPQMHWQMMCTATRECAFSVIEGASAPTVDVMRFDDDYGVELLRRAETFMECVRSLTSPFACAPVTAPDGTTREGPSPLAAGPVVAPVRAVKVYDMAGQNEWAAFAADWLANHAAGAVADKAEKELKALMPADAERSHGFGVEITRDRAGKMKLRQLEA